MPAADGHRRRARTSVWAASRTPPPLNSRLTSRRQTRSIGDLAQLSIEAAARYTPVAVMRSIQTRPAVLPGLIDRCSGVVTSCMTTSEIFTSSRAPSVSIQAPG